MKTTRINGHTATPVQAHVLYMHDEIYTVFATLKEAQAQREQVIKDIENDFAANGIGEELGEPLDASTFIEIKPQTLYQMATAQYEGQPIGMPVFIWKD